MPLAFYRKYRPRQFKDLIGQEEAVRLLSGAAKKGRLAHAYLLAGPRGTGKTTTARIIAKIANCLDDSVKGSRGEPCNACRECREIDAGQSLNVIEIDAASNRGIDEVRELKEGIGGVPFSGSHKVFIIDEAHMLTPPAWNALLKTLEEPPAHAIFVLATTESGKIPATIASRAQRYYFKRLPLAVIVSKLKQIASAEKIAAADEALELVAAAAEGGMRDAETLLEQLTHEGKLTVETVERFLGRAGLGKISQLAEFILKRDLKSSLYFLADLDNAGYNLIDLNKELITYLRRALALNLEPSLVSLYEKELTAEQLKKIREHSHLAQKNTTSIIKSLIRAMTEMRYSPLTIVPLEIAIIENLQ